MADTLSCSRFLDRLAEMVPAKYFVDSGKVNDTGSQFWHSKSVKAQKKQEAAREGKLRKREKFDPESAKSTVEVQKIEYGKKKQKRVEAAKLPLNVVDDSVQFQKLEFNVSDKGGEDAKAQKKKTKQKLLKEALKKKERSEKDAGNEAAWEDALAKAEGKKVLPSPKSLQKAIKKEKKLKEKKKDKWKQIEEDQKAKRDEKQKKRKENLKDRTKRKIERKIKRKK